ncbi:MAG: alpha-amylase family glycosyl hydrolase [Acholeplasmataceae bacterium]
MKKLWMMILLTILSVVIISCQETPVEPEESEETPWKITYDIKDASPHFYNEVSVCYQIFPIAFADSNGDGLGDLNGITENLDYLSETLNVDCIWLNPINPSPTYHKYDVTDYYGIDQQFGTMADFEALIEAADAVGIKILMDLVINHSSSQHPWFINATTGPAASYRDFYVWNDLTDREAFPIRTGWYMNNGMYYYASFWSEMPELNFDNPAVREEINNITTFWLEKGVGGFRIDAARHIYDINEYPLGTPTNRENINYFRAFNHHVKTINPDAFVVGEVYVNSSSFVAGFYEGMDSAFNFEFSDALITALQQGYDTDALDVIFESREAFGRRRDDYIDSFFLTNHDQDRIIGRLDNNPDKMKLAAHIMMTLPGISWIYYGEELGMSGPKPDPSIRQPFKWGNERLSYTTQSRPNGIAAWNTQNQNLIGMTEQLLDETSILSAYINAIELRKTHKTLHQGDILRLTNNDQRLLTFLRVDGDDIYLVVHNLSSQSVSRAHNLTSYEVIYHTHTLDDQQTSFVFQPFSSTVIKINTTNVSLS